jgi:hypothetical protein
VSTTAQTLDRVVTFIIGLTLIAVGVLAIIWRLDLYPTIPDRTNTSAALARTTTPWWPWAVTIAGLILVLLGVRWLWAHLPIKRVAQLNIPGTGPKGRLQVNTKAVAAAAGDALTSTTGIRSARGTINRDRGQIVVDLRATADADANLHAIANGADQVAAELAQVLERPDLYCRVRINVTTTNKTDLQRVQ